SLSPCCFPDTGTPASCPLSLPDALPICRGGTEHPAADVRYPRQFQQPLYRAVLTVFAVEYGKDHIDGDLVGRLALRQHQDAAHTPIRWDDGRYTRWVLHPRVAGDILRRSVVFQPLPLPGDAQEGHVIQIPVQSLDDGMGRLQGDIVLR